MHLTRAITPVVLALSLLACDEAGGADDAGPSGTTDAGPPEAELGTGEVEFEPLAEGDELPYILGPQGGYHFLASVRVRGVEPGNPDMLADPSNPTVEFRAFQGDTRVDARASSYRQGLDPAPGEPGTYQMVGRLLILNITSCDALTDEAIRVEVEVTDVFGVSATDERTITAVPDPFTCG
ncbi:MAG TPA: hypothetical protein RMH99_28180 [Sandaracinaceae bacterium LLY-WYZ-13_1]|nr:hypothetical protein [Sandaracinaceae bacterium LLY-WYZ-13_1]